MFKPLAFTKTFAMAAAALLSVTLVPALMVIFVRGRIVPEARNPDQPRPDLALPADHPRWCSTPRRSPSPWRLLILAASVWPALRLGSEFMPTLNEGVLLYMPTTLPGLSITKAAELLQTQNKIIKSFPEVETVWGKAGRAATATDPAPIEMFETTITLKPESQWRPGMTVEKLVAEMDKALQFPGVSNAWTMPIKARIDMLATGIRTPVGVKVMGRDLNGDRASGARDRGGDPHGSGHVERLRRAHHGRLLPGDRAGPGATRPLWPDGRRHAGGDRDGASAPSP